MRQWIAKHANIWSFLTIFSICIALETISSTYLIASLQSIERQFQIGSQLSGVLVSVHEVGYVLTVTVLAYLGSRGNRARWIGSGCLLIAFACVLIALPYFIFPYKTPEFNITAIRQEVSDTYIIHPKEVSTPHKLLHHRIIGPRLPEWASRVLKTLQPKQTKEEEEEEYDRYFELFIKDTLGQKRLRRDLYSEPIGASAFFDGLPYPDNEVYDFMEEVDLINEEYYYEEVPVPIYRKKRQVWNISSQLKNMITDVTLGKRRFIELSHPISREVNALIVQAFSSQKLHHLMSSARLPFTYCNEVVVAVKRILERDKCGSMNTNKIAAAIICLGVALIGIGHSMPWTLGMPLIDDNVQKGNAPLYFAIVFFLRIMGPLLGFMLGAGTNRLYFTLKKPPGITMQDSRWIGAWWLGYLLIGVCLFLPSLMLFFFPRLDRETRKASLISVRRMSKPSTTKPLLSDAAPQADDQRPSVVVRRRSSILEPKAAWAEIKEFLLTLLVVLKCPVFIGCNFSKLLEAFTMKGMLSFQPKYVENHFGIPQYKANLYLGSSGVLTFAMGVVVGSVIMKRWKLDGRRAALYLLTLSLITGTVCFSNVFVSCHSVTNSIGQIGRQTGFNYMNKCNTGCECDNSELFPVCDRDSNPYFSPCHAGCRNLTMTDERDQEHDFTFTQCDCVDVGTEASAKWCSDDCHIPIIVFFIVFTLNAFLSGLGVIPGVLMLMRSVPDEHRSIALGFSAFLISLISTMPAPIVYGTFLDSGCLLWNESCGSVGSCAVYDPQIMRKWFFGLSGAIRISTIFSDIWVWYWAKNVKLFDEAEVS